MPMNRTISETCKLVIEKMQHFFPIMVFLFLMMATSSYAANAKNTRIKLSMKDTPMRTILEEIEKQSQYRFLYSDNAIDSQKPQSIKINGTIEVVLKALFINSGLQYKMLENNLIVISSKKSTVNHTKASGGKVTDESGDPLPGVTVMVKGGNKKTITDASGNYSMTELPDNAVLVFSYIGMPWCLRICQIHRTGDAYGRSKIPYRLLERFFMLGRIFVCLTP